MTNIRRISVEQVITSSLLGLALVMAATLPYIPLVRAGDITCDPLNPLSANFNANVEVNGLCDITSLRGNGNVMLDAAADNVRYQGVRFNGNIECKNGTVNVGTLAGATVRMNGNVKGENCDAAIDDAIINSNVEFKGPGSVEIRDEAEIFGNVKHDGPGACTVDTTGGAVVHGNLEGTCVAI